MFLSQLTEEYKEAMKQKNETKKSVLNYLLAQIKNKKIDQQRDLTDEEIIALMRKEIKAIDETISFLEKAGKTDEIQEEKAKQGILQGYLPRLFSEEETEALLEKMITELSITDLKTQRGLIMKTVKEQYASQVDGALLNSLINKRL